MPQQPSISLSLNIKKEKSWKTKQPQTSPAEARENIMGTMEINPLLVKLSIPMMISMLVQALYNVVDSVFVSHVSESALTAVSLAFSLQNLMIAVGVGTGVGMNALLSKSLGEKNQSRANRPAKTASSWPCALRGLCHCGRYLFEPYFYAQTVCRHRAAGHPVCPGVPVQLHRPVLPVHHGRLLRPPAAPTCP